jgi:DNA-directed RNA polymerase sigma subunit (sigma70/sigma32)
LINEQQEPAMTGYVYSEDVLPEIYGLEIEMKSTDASQKPLLSAQQQRALMNLVRVDDPETKQRVIAHNLHLVVNIAKRYSDHGVALLDLVREGTVGLIHALENFDLEGGFRFAAYAAQCVRQRIECAILNQKNNLSFAAFQITPSLVSEVSFEQVA